MNRLAHKMISYFAGIVVCLSFSVIVLAQDQQAQQQGQPQVIQLQSPHPKDKLVQRLTIDGKRIGTNMNSDDALPRSREFIRTDSTYYVGWMYEGAYKYNHAADYIGFKNASVSLERALRLCERDYHKALATRTSSLLEYYPVYKIDIDYTMIAYYLMTCYANMEEPDQVYKLLRRVLRWNFQRQFYMDAYDYLAWTVHRERFYTSAKYPFLKNSIGENEALANRYLDTGMRKLLQNREINAHIFQPGYDQMDIYSVYHYKCILYSYNFNIDSAQHYFDLMRTSGIFPHNNYATFRAVCGDFRTAEAEYKNASGQDAGDKRLQEWAYYTSIIDIYKAKPKAGIQLMKDMIMAAGSTPGFGWYNIAQARALLYDGQIAEAKRYAEKAAGFKELHIGTTLGQADYDFSIQLIKLIDKENEWAQQKFEHKNWWYNPNTLYNMGQLLGEKYLQQFLIINQFAQNPERDRVIYKLFSTESTVSWDEVWYLIKDFSTQFFLDRFRSEANTDNRKYVRKYFQLFVARLEMKQGKYREARALLDQLLQAPDVDMQYEKLFVARLFQAEAECADALKDHEMYNDYLYRLYVTYPQLVPFTGQQMNMVLHVAGNVDEQVIARLKDCNINFVTNSAIPSANVYITFIKHGNRNDIQYYVTDRTGAAIVDQQSFAYTTAGEAGTSLAYRLFNIGGKMPESNEGTGDAPAALPQ